MISYIFLRVRGSAITMILLVVIMVATGVFVSSFQIASPYIKIHPSRQLSIRIQSSSNTRLHVASTTSPTRRRTTSAATLSYLNSLQSITSNPQLFPATSDTIEALLSQQQQQQLQNWSLNSDSDIDGAGISPKDFLMNLSREVLLASTTSQEEQEVAGEQRQTTSEHHYSSSENSIASPSLPLPTTSSADRSSVTNVNLISEGMTAEEAATTRNNRLHKNYNYDSTTAATTSTETDGINNINKQDMNTIAMTITEGMTAEEAQKARMARMQQSTTTTTTSPPPPPPSANRGVSGLRQAVASSKRIKEPFSQTSSSSSYDPYEASWNEGSASYNTDNNIQDDELLSSSSPSTKFLGVSVTNPNTPLIATTTGLATGLASYEVIDDYAYQFNSAHNNFIVNQMDRKDMLVEQWDELVGTYFLPLEHYLKENIVVVGGVGGSAEQQLSSFAASPSTADTVAMDQGSAIHTPPSVVSTDTAATVPDNAVASAPIEQLSDTSASVGTTIESPDTATVTTPTAPLEAATVESTTSTTPSLNEIPAVDKEVVTAAAGTPASVESSGNTNLVPDTATATAAPVEATQSVQESTTESVAASAAPSLNVGTVEEVAITNAHAPSSDIGSGSMDLFTDGTAASAVIEPPQYSDVAATAAAGASTITAAPSLNDATVDVDAPINAAQYVDTVSTVQVNDVEISINDIKVEEVVANNAQLPSYESRSTDLLADATTPAEQAHSNLPGVEAVAKHYSETTTVPSMDGATVNKDAGNAPAATFESGHTELLADATTSATSPTQMAEMTGADTTSVKPSLNDVNSIDQNVMNAPTSSYDSGNTDLFADSTHQQRWFTAPPSTDQYTRTDYASTVDQSGYSSGGFSFEGGSNGGSSLHESYSSWHSQGGSNPLRELAASLPPPEDRVRGTGGDYYPEALSCQWPTTQSDGFHTVADTAPVTSVNSLADNGYEASVSAISSDSLDSLTAQSPDISYEHIFNEADKIDSDALSGVASSVDASVNDALISAKTNLFGSVSHSLGDIQGKADAGVSFVKGLGNGGHLPFDTHTFEGAVQNAGNAFQSIHPPAAVSSAIQHASDASLADIGNGVMDAVKFMAGILLTVVDANIDLAAPGSSSASVLTSVRTSVNAMLDNASHTVANVINDVGNLSLKDIIHNLMVLIVATADMIMKIMNAVVYLLSGKDAGNWALQASSTVNDATSQLLAQADDITHQSIGNLASSIGDYSYHVGNDLVALLGSLNGVEGEHLNLDGTLEMVTTAIQTGFTM